MTLFWCGPHSICGVCISPNKSTSYLSLRCSQNSLWWDIKNLSLMRPGVWSQLKFYGFNFHFFFFFQAWVSDCGFKSQSEEHGFTSVLEKCHSLWAFRHSTVELLILCFFTLNCKGRLPIEKPNPINWALNHLSMIVFLNVNKQTMLLKYLNKPSNKNNSQINKKENKNTKYDP